MFIASLWMPIVLSAVLVFVASSLVHMVLKWHNGDYRGFANDDEVRAAIRAGNPAPGMYVTPYCPDMKDMGKPETQKKFVDGPVAFVTLRPNGPPSMGRPLVLWFLFSLGVSGVAAYIASKTLQPGASFLQVCRVAGVLAFAAYAGGSIQAGIWMGKPWGSVAKDLLDGLIYGALTGAAFGWLWPR